MSGKSFVKRKPVRRLLSFLLCLSMLATLLSAAAGADRSFIGDASPDNCEIKIIGLVEKPGYFTMEGLKSYAGNMLKTEKFKWLNSAGSSDVDTFTGVYFEDLLKSIMTLSGGAKAITVTAGDGFVRSFKLDAGDRGVYWTDSDGNKMMLALNGTASRTNRDIVDFELPRIVVGQITPEDINRAHWVSDIIEIRVTVFDDHAGYEWATEAVEALAANGVTTGVGDGRFDPAGKLTRAMFVTFLGRAMKADSSASGGNKLFPDVNYNDYYGPYVEWAVEKGLVTGHTDGTFKPGNDLTVEHLLIIANRAGLAEIPEKIDAGAKRPATRAEAAVIMYALMKRT